jgi:hypothetical protein
MIAAQSSRSGQGFPQQFKYRSAVKPGITCGRRHNASGLTKGEVIIATDP